MRKAFLFSILILVSVFALNLKAQDVPSFNSSVKGTVSSNMSLGSGVNNYSVGYFNACSSVGNTGIRGVVGCLIGIVDALVYLIMAFSVVFVLYSGLKLIRAEGDDDRKESKNQMIWGIVGLFAMVSIWGFVQILQSTFGLTNSRPIQPPPLYVPSSINK